MTAVLTRASASKHTSTAKTNVVGLATSRLQQNIQAKLRSSVRADALRTNDGTLCSFEAEYNNLHRVGFADTLPDYLKVLNTRITNFDLPLGASLETRPTGEVVLQVPKVTFMDLYVFPTSTLEVSYTEGVGAVIHAPETEIHGSHHVESLNCNDRFEMKLNIVLKAQEDILNSSATFALDVDVPFPLNVTPRPLIESTGNVAVQRTLSSLMDTLCASVVRDHIEWSKERQAPALAKGEALAVAA